jgi:hypothetical protein
MNQFTPECQLVVECLDGTNRPLPDILALAVKYWHRALEVQISKPCFFCPPHSKRIRISGWRGVFHKT